MSSPGERDDDAVRETLRAEAARLSAASPHEALGLPAGAGADDARTAFRILAKRYHPTRFARRDRDVVRLANEVFLMLRHAYEGLSGTPRKRPRTTAPPAVTAAPAAPPPPNPDTAAAAERAKALRAARAARFARQLGYDRKSAEASRASTAEVKPAGDEPPTSEPAPAQPPRRGGTGPGGTPGGTFDELLAGAREDEARADEQFRAAAAILDERDTDRAGEARQTLQALAAANPQNRSYRAHFHCAIALERAADGRIADARAEIERALALEPRLRSAHGLKRELAAGRRLLGRLRKR